MAKMAKAETSTTAKRSETSPGEMINTEDKNMKKTYKIEVDCAACAEKMQDAIKATEGVKDAVLSFMTLKVKVEFEEGADPEKVMQAARTNVKKIEDDMEIFL